MINKEYKPVFKVTNKIIELVGKIKEKLSIVFLCKDFLILNKKIKIKSIYSSVKIEGNPYDFQTFYKVINNEEKEQKDKYKLEFKNALKAYKTIEEVKNNNVENFLKIHKILMNNIIKSAGKTRSRNVGVYENGTLIHMAPPANFVNNLLIDLFEWYNNDISDVLIKSCAFHYELEFIHPFEDGNGRIGRLWHRFLLNKENKLYENLQLENIVYENVNNYYKALHNSNQKGDCSEFIECMLTFILKAIERNEAYDFDSLNEVEKLTSILSSGPKSRQEIMDLLNIKSRITLQKSYIKPALEQQKIMIIGKLNSPKVKYKLVENNKE